MNRASMDRFIDTIEWIAAGFVGIVALNIFIAVILRNTMNYAIPDTFDIGRMLLGILIFWGIAATYGLNTRYVASECLVLVGEVDSDLGSRRNLPKF